MTVLAVRGGRVFGGTSWSDPGDIVVRGGCIDETTDPDSADTVIDASGCWIVPSLTDAHCHLLPGHLSRLPAFGVGFAVDMFSTPVVRSALDRDAKASGASYVTAGVGATVRGGHPYQLVASGLYDDFPSVDEVGGPSAFVDRVAGSGASFVKIFLEDGRLAGVDLPTLDRYTVEALVEEAHARGLPVIAHVSSVDRAIEGLLCGIDGLAHAPVPRSAADIDAFVSCATSCSAFVVSTLVATASALGLPQTGTVLDSPLGKNVSLSWRRHLRTGASSTPDHEAYDRVLQLAAAADAASIPLFPGTDAAFPGVMPGASLHVELEILASCGISTGELLRSATVGIRERLGIGGDPFAPGRRADFLVLAEDPSASISATASITWVILGERIYRADA